MTAVSSSLRLLCAAWLTCLSATAVAAEPAAAPLQVYAAGSVGGALAAIAKQYTAQTGQPIDIVPGPAGLLLERIEQGAPADIYISANMTHPQVLADQGKGLPPVVFTRNRLCVLARPDEGLTSANLLDRLLLPRTRIGTSTPGADPGGDYAWQWFAKAGSVRPGAQQILQGKAQQLVGGRTPPEVPAGVNPVKYFLLQNKIDVFFGYCSSHETRADPRLVLVEVPPELAIPVNYGMTVLRRPQAPQRQADADRFALYLMSSQAQRQLRAYDFMPVADGQQP